jgi:hypothetical protein
MSEERVGAGEDPPRDVEGDAAASLALAATEVNLGAMTRLYLPLPVEAAPPADAVPSPGADDLMSDNKG